MFTKNHPKSLWILSFGKMWDTFSYFGTQTILALYSIKIFGISISDSYLIYGAYAAFAFSTPILGGIIADKWLGSKRSLIFGAALNIFGNILLISLHRYIFCLGLATSIIGSGLYKSNATHLVGSLYEKGDFKKEQGYTWFYLSMNLGGTFAPLIYGLIAYSYKWNFVFLFSAFGILSGTVWILSNWDTLEIVATKNKLLSNVKSITIYSLIIASCFLLSLPFYFPSTINRVIAITFCIGLLYLILSINRYSGKSKQRLLALLLISFLGLFYFAAGLQIGTSITLFIQTKIHEGVINTRLPASTFSMLYTLFVLLLAPVFAYLWIKLKDKNIIFNAPKKLAIGIILAAFGIFSFLFASLTNLVLTGIITGNLLLSAGELVLSPSIYTAISDLAPEGMKSTMMGCWLLFVALGGYVSSILANIAHSMSEKMLTFHSIYSGQFLLTGLFTGSVGIIVIMMVPKLTKMMR